MTSTALSSLETCDIATGHEWEGHDSTATCPSQSPSGCNGLTEDCLVVHSES
jgi:hypothetical protein